MWGICSSPTSTDRFSTPGYSLRPLGDGDPRYAGCTDDFSKVVGQLYLEPPTYQVVRPSRVGICTEVYARTGFVSGRSPLRSSCNAGER